MPESVGRDQGFRVDDEGGHADDGEGGEEGDGDEGDGSLHEGALGGIGRTKGYWGGYCQEECKNELIFTHHIIILRFLVQSQIVAQDNYDNDGCWADDIVSKESSAHCHSNSSEDEVGGEEEGSLEGFQKCRLRSPWLRI